jgi:hypothetical protein
MAFGRTSTHDGDEQRTREKRAMVVPSLLALRTDRRPTYGPRCTLQLNRGLHGQSARSAGNLAASTSRRGADASTVAANDDPLAEPLLPRRRGAGPVSRHASTGTNERAPSLGGHPDGGAFWRPSRRHRRRYEHRDDVHQIFHQGFCVADAATANVSTALDPSASACTASHPVCLGCGARVLGRGKQPGTRIDESRHRESS